MKRATTKAAPLPLDTHEILAAAIERSQKTKSQFAHSAGMNSGDLGKYLRPDGSSMSTATLARVLEANGLKPVVSFQPIR